MLVKRTQELGRGDGRGKGSWCWRTYAGIGGRSGGTVAPRFRVKGLMWQDERGEGWRIRFSDSTPPFSFFFSAKLMLCFPPLLPPSSSFSFSWLNVCRFKWGVDWRKFKFSCCKIDMKYFRFTYSWIICVVQFSPIQIGNTHLSHFDSPHLEFY